VDVGWVFVSEVAYEGLQGSGTRPAPNAPHALSTPTPAPAPAPPPLQLLLLLETPFVLLLLLLLLAVVLLMLKLLGMRMLVLVYPWGPRTAGLAGGLGGSPCEEPPTWWGLLPGGARGWGEGAGASGGGCQGLSPRLALWRYALEALVHPVGGGGRGGWGQGEPRGGEVLHGPRRAGDDVVHTWRARESKEARRGGVRRQGAL